MAQKIQKSQNWTALRRVDSTGLKIVNMVRPCAPLIGDVTHGIKPKPHNKTRGGPCWDAWAVAAGCSAGCKQSETQFQSRSGIWVQVSKVVVDTWSQMKGRMGLSPRYGREFHPFVRPYSKISKFLCEKSCRNRHALCSGASLSAPSHPLPSDVGGGHTLTASGAGGNPFELVSAVKKHRIYIYM